MRRRSSILTTREMFTRADDDNAGKCSRSNGNAVSHRFLHSAKHSWGAFGLHSCWHKEERRMNRNVTLRWLVVCAALTAAAWAAPVRLRCEYLVNPLGIDQSAPHLSWQSDSAERNWKQADRKS